MSRLNARQREAVHYISGPLLVLAGAGSGKTSVITSKITYLVEQCGIKAKHIAAVTFTNKAAREMRERVSKLLPAHDAKGLIVATFHNLGLTILREEHKILGYKAGFSIFDSEDAKALIRDIMIRDFGDEGEEVNQVQAAISNLKNDMCEPDRAISVACNDHELMIAQVYKTYNQYLKAYNAVDFDDLILLIVALFRQHPEVLEKWQNRVRYLLVDEYQDTNIAQYELVKMLVETRSAFTVVGDDDQSIYAWRGARPENLVKLNEDFPSLKVIKLEQNYRSTSRILKVANAVIANNPHVFEKALWSELGMGDEIRIIQTRNEDAESERIAVEILDHKLKKNTHFRDYAVLYRGNHQSRLLEMKLQAHQVPYRISGGTSFFAKNEIKDAMGYLRLLINPEDDAAFLRVVNVPRREIGPSTLEKLGEYATERDISLYRAVDELGLEQRLPEKAIQKLRQFRQWLERTAEDCQRKEAISVLKQMFTDIEYEDWLYQNSNTPKQAERRMDNVWYLVDSIQRMLERDKGLADEMTLESAISRLLLMDMLEQQQEEDDTDKVHLLTLHASKGLEFPHCFIMGLEEEILPHRNSIEENNIEEERRLMYVGITRAKKTLTMTYAAQRKQYGEKIETIPSRFLDEMPEEDLVWFGKGEKDPDANKAKGRETLASLRNLMDGL
ncbi:MAG: DNA helicase Rep [Pseudomonadales bacterium]|uniref:ATP-dependent DNA helicase Rep n=1 Tax=Oleiphilus messinensis TaxID=141451 RepID=A0A1Y0I3W5_9GAMM|nr:DNA helicase Rep [Oleiphilus messinensis]ARU54215.1 RepA type ATP-dependent DNA helicase [Oleiphilus messinensis]MCG8609972.1 DNA helicase Rep [Pseudomonadales bacterium]